jgi:hypothetical protein
VGHSHFDLVIMNPPFTRHGAREGDRTLVHNPAFAAFEASEEEQDQLANRVKQVASEGPGHGHAGLASYFADLAHRKAKTGGTVALVLPFSSMSGKSWEDTRSRWREHYSSISVVTISDKGSHSRSFSADTDIAECLFVAKREKPSTDEPRATFVVLNRQPQTTLEGELIAQAISGAVDGGKVRKLEQGPFGGTRIFLGDTEVAEALDCAVPSEGPWQMVGITDLSLAQSAHQLSVGQLWIEGMAQENAAEIPVATIGQISVRMGPHDLDINGSEVKGDGLPQGPFEKIPGTPSRGDAYPCLWNHDSQRERRLMVAPDCRLEIRDVGGKIPARLAKRAQERWATATRAHYNRDLRFNSQSLVVAFTEEVSMGGQAWPSVVLQNPDHEYAFALWGNSTLGLLAHWWTSNKSQEGRGRTTITSIPHIPALDVHALSKSQHQAAKVAFKAMAKKRFLPLNQVHEDPARAELDRRLLVDILGLDARLCDAGGPVQRLRAKLAAEPQVHGSKKTRVVFTKDGEKTARIGSTANV